ncbi:MAG TPA: hypothetical protein VE619_01275 [Nitrososphaeraceae archaeon]|nr:hypothetical protein [Nitrososphaeraceae archaeon]
MRQANSHGVYSGVNDQGEWTSQFCFNNLVNEQVHKQPLYNKHGPLGIANEQDGIYTGASTDDLVQSNTGKHLMLYLTKEGRSYIGLFNIVLNSSQSGY